MNLLSSILIGAVASARSMTPMAALATARKRAMARVGQTRSGLVEDALVVAAGAAIVALATGRRL